MKKCFRRKKVLFGVLIIAVCIITILALLMLKIEKHNEQQVEEHNKQITIIGSLKYDAIEANGTRYYPIPTSLYWLPVSLPPQGSKTVYKVVNGKTDYSRKYHAKTFVDDYDQNYLFMDGVVFERPQEKS